MDLFSLTNLQTYFKQIKCDGEVSINRPDNPSSYSKYELQIKVRFRDSVPLEALNVGRQSGGERSVSTMLFLLAMPTKNCPFRLVDEINQVKTLGECQPLSVSLKTLWSLQCPMLFGPLTAHFREWINKMNEM